MALSVGQTFLSLQDFETTLKNFEAENNVLFVRKTSRKLVPYHPEEDRLKYQYILYGCKQGKKRETKSQGIRPNQRTIKLDCGAYIRVASVQVNGEWLLKVTGANHCHENHPTDYLTASLYPENRRPEVTETVKMMASRKVPPSELRQYIQSRQGINILPKDIENLLAKLSKTDKADSETVQEILESIKGAGGVTKFGVNEDGEFEYLFFVTEQMKHDLCDFCNVLVMDATYKVNRYLYPLVIVLCIDDEGRGRPVLHGFVRNESRLSLLSCLHFLKSVMSDLTCDPSVFFVDKDFAEIAAVRETFPDSFVKLCAFHASTAVKRALTNQGLSSQQVDTFLKIFKEQRDTRSQERFHELCDSVRRDAPDRTVEYFETNWWSTLDMWANHTTLDLQTLHLTATNHVESYHGKIKRTLHPQTRLSDSIRTLLNYNFERVQTKDMQSHVSLIAHYYNVQHKDPNLDHINNSLTSFGSRIVSEQYNLAKKISYTHTPTPSSSTQTTDTFKVSSESFHDGHTYTTTLTGCNCEFFRRFALTCRHLFSLRHHLSLPLSYPEMFLSSRFLTRNRLTSYTLTTDRPDRRDQPETDCDIVPVQRVTTQEGRYRIISAVTSRINSLFQDMGAEQFNHRVGQLQNFLALVTADKDFAFVDRTVQTVNETSTVTVTANSLTETSNDDLTDPTPNNLPWTHSDIDRPLDPTVFPNDTNVTEGDVKPCVTNILNGPNSETLYRYPALPTDTNSIEDDVKPCVTDNLHGPNSETLERYQAFPSDTNVRCGDLKSCVTDHLNGFNFELLQRHSKAFLNNSNEGDVKPCVSDISISPNTEPRQIQRYGEFSFKENAGTNDVKHCVTNLASLSNCESTSPHQNLHSPVPTHLITNTVSQSVSSVIRSNHNTTVCKEDEDCRDAKRMHEDLDVIKSYTLSLRPVSQDLFQSEMDDFVSGEEDFENDIADTPLSFSTQIADHVGQNQSKSKGDRPGECIAFEQNYYLRRYVNPVSVDKSHEGTSCPSKFTSTSNISCREDIKLDREEKQCRFHECGKTWRRTQSVKKPIKCNECGKSFSQKDNLHVHMRTHNGENSFKCDECGKSCSQNIHLNAHMRKHAGEKPFKCNECGKSFSHKSHLHAHMRTHILVKNPSN